MIARPGTRRRPTTLVTQGKDLDAETVIQLRNLAADESGVTLPTETLLRAAALLLAEQGRPAGLAEVEEFLTAAVGS